MLPFHFHLQPIKMKGGSFEGHVRNKIINYKEEESGLFKQWMRIGKGHVAEFEVFQSIQQASYDKKGLLACGSQEEKLLDILKEEIRKEQAGAELSQAQPELELQLSLN